MRKIIHIDMDAFFASIEQRDDPRLRNRPVLVGGKPNSRGVVAAASYEARAYGVHSAMPCAQAARLCPDAVFVPPRFDAYRQASDQIRAIFQAYSDAVEPLSLDEAYLDVTASCGDRTATALASEIRARIFEETQLTASAGISYNKFLAKMASDMRKPNGQFVVPPEHGRAFVAQLPIGKFYGVGQATESKMQALGIHNGADLARWQLPALQKHFGKWSQFLYDIARGVDHRAVDAGGERKSIGAETTFAQNLKDPNAMLDALSGLADRVCAALAKRKLQAGTVTLKARYPDFETVTRQCRAAPPVTAAGDLQRYLEPLLARTQASEKSVRLLGLSLSALEDIESRQPRQLDLKYPSD